MNRWEIEKSQKIVRFGGVKLGRCTNFPSILHFEIDNQDKTFAEVFYSKNKDGLFYWTCNFQAKNGYSCVFQNNKTEPFCVHTKAAELFWNKIRKTRY